jgi:hypothetical protein
VVLEGRSDLAEAAVFHRAMEYFVGTLGMRVVSENARAISFEGEKGAVNLTVDDDGPDSVIQLLTDGVEREAREFMEALGAAPSGSGGG